ncbi:MAG: MvdC/MvdD family ATP grasp protein [Streptosporangiaceae bacterium]
MASQPNLHELDLLTHSPDGEPRGRGVPVARVDPAEFPARVSLTAEVGAGQPWSGTITDPKRGPLADLASVSSVYYRHPAQFQLAEGMSGPEKVFAYGEARRGFGGVIQALQDCLWINDPVAAARCEYKPVQLAAAVSVGLTVPRTIITSDPQRAYEWALRLGQPIVYKTMAGIWHADEGQLRVIYTTPVTDPEDVRDPALARTAHMFQVQIIDKEREARALVVGDRVFTVAIDADSERGHVDWRSDYESHTYEVIDLPGAVNDKLVELHGRLGLTFGAVDLIQRTRGDWVFLETDQGGEWGWLAEETGVPVAPALADMLERGAPCSR